MLTRDNNIDKLIIEGDIVDNPTDITREIISFYQKLYTETENWRPLGNLGNCPRITQEENQLLQSPFG